MRSDNVKKGMQQAPHRSLFNALGFTEEEMKKPLVGIVSSYNEIVPGHMNLDKIVNAVKLGVAMAGGTPVVFPAIAVCDGIAMGHVGMKYSLVTRDLIADSTEAMALAHQFDALVMVPNCDKNVPGLLMAAARINVPTVFVSGGPMLAGHVKGKKRSLSSMFEAVGSYSAGTMTAEDVEEFENKVCPTCGSCSERSDLFRSVCHCGQKTPAQLHPLHPAQLLLHLCLPHADRLFSAVLRFFLHSESDLCTGQLLQILILLMLSASFFSVLL